MLNCYLEDYLRCFAADNPRLWTGLLPWPEWHYNTALHSIINMSPFEAVVGQSLPTLTEYITGSSTVPSINNLLTERATKITILCENLQLAQTQMRNQANAKRIDVEVFPGDWALIKLHPYR